MSDPQDKKEHESPTRKAEGNQGNAADPLLMSDGGHATFVAATANVVEFSEGEVIADQFDVTRVIGRGGMGIVYEVRDRITREQLALKAILPAHLTKPRAAERFVQEVNIARRLRDPGIVAVYDVRQVGPLLFYTMELVGGRSLRQILDERGKLPVSEALDIVIRLCGVLEYAHQLTVHRDISPENVMVLADDSIKLLDFGIAKAVGTDLTLTTDQPMGKAFYMAPEQREPGAQVDGRADIFSLAIMLFEMLTGEFPSGYNTLGRLCPDISPAFEKVVMRGLADKQKRFKTAGEFSQALLQAHRGSAVGSAGTDTAAALSSGASPVYQARKDALGNQDADQRQRIRPKSGSFQKVLGTGDGAPEPRAASSPSGHDLQGVLDELHLRPAKNTPPPTGRSSGFDVPPLAAPVSGAPGADVPVFGRSAPNVPTPAPKPATSSSGGKAASSKGKKIVGGFAAVAALAAAGAVILLLPLLPGLLEGMKGALSTSPEVRQHIDQPSPKPSNETPAPQPARAPAPAPERAPAPAPEPPPMIPLVDQQALETIYVAINCYRETHNGANPPTLRTLVPNCINRVPRSSNGKQYDYEPGTGTVTVPN